MDVKIIFFFTLLFVAVAMAAPAPNAEEDLEVLVPETIAAAEGPYKIPFEELCFKEDKACIARNKAKHHQKK